MWEEESLKWISCEMNSFPSWLSPDALARDYPLRPRRKYRSFVSILYLRWTWKDVKKGTTLFREVDRCRRFKDTEVCHSYLPHNVSHPRSKTAGISMEAIHRGWIESEREREPCLRNILRLRPFRMNLYSDLISGAEFSMGPVLLLALIYSGKLLFGVVNYRNIASRVLLQIFLRESRLRDRFINNEISPHSRN